MLNSKHRPVLKRPTSELNRATVDLNFLKTSTTVSRLYSRCWNLGGLSLMSERLMVTVAVAENAPVCPTISLAWMMTKYWSFVSLSIWEAILMTPKNEKYNIIPYKDPFFPNIWPYNKGIKCIIGYSYEFAFQTMHSTTVLILGISTHGNIYTVWQIHSASLEFWRAEHTICLLYHI